MKLNEDIVVVAIFEKSGKLVFRKLRKKYEKKLKDLSKQVEISIVRSIMMLSIADSADRLLGKTEYLLICRKNYKSLVQIFPSTNLALRITFKNRMYGKILYNQLIPLLKKYAREFKPSLSSA
ncbi:MAG TPA: hypothetical protein VNE86_00875 [Nitrososphaerales archaeon]|nr:hypothetical protein [Nitrososphaerales archaeon]